MNRIKSYTVIEMLVVMLVSSLSIAISYTCYSLFSNHYTQYKQNSDSLANHILVDKLLAKDISMANRIVRTAEGIRCVKKKEQIQYEFMPTYILRKGIAIDTFYVSLVGEPKFKIKEEIQNIPEGLIEEIELDVVYKEENLYFYYKKEYGADLFMNNEN